MRLFFTLLLLLSVKTFAQNNSENKTIEDIPSMERRAHRGIAMAANATLASSNFDVKYYRCEWEVDPAIRYIKGEVTVYYVLTSATNSITLDLMNDLVTNSVLQRGLSLTKSQANNTLTIN